MPGGVAFIAALADELRASLDFDSMSMSQQAAVSAVAFQLVAALEAYELDLQRLCEHRKDLDRFERISRRVDEMRPYSVSLPAVSVPWAAFLISHFEFTHCLWRRVTVREQDDTRLRQLQGRHLDALASLRQRTLRLADGDWPAAA